MYECVQLCIYTHAHICSYMSSYTNMQGEVASHIATCECL